MKYTENDKSCLHCGGNVTGHICGEKVIRWCDKCGSNDTERPPSVIIEHLQAENTELRTFKNMVLDALKNNPLGAGKKVLEKIMADFQRAKRNKIERNGEK